MNNNLKAARKSAKLTQQAVAKQINVTPATLSRYESGDIQPDPETLKSLSVIYGVSIDYLLGVAEKSSGVTVVDLETSALDKALKLLQQMDEGQRKTAIALLKALAEQNNN